MIQYTTQTFILSLTIVFYIDKNYNLSKLYLTKIINGQSGHFGVFYHCNHNTMYSVFYVINNHNTIA